MKPFEQLYKNILLPVLFCVFIESLLLNKNYKIPFYCLYYRQINKGN